MPLLKNMFSALSALFVILNLGFWMLPIFFFGLIKLLFGKIPGVSQFCIRTLELLYRIAVTGNNLWMSHIVGVKCHVTGEIPSHPAPIIIVNHQTWMDIPVLHQTITRNGPTLKFLVKRELLWVPIVGWICYALNFPALRRGQGAEARQKDLAAIHSFSSALSSEPGALLIFAEGTRFTPVKQKNQNSPHKHLLKPRPGGLKIALERVPADTPVLDVTIHYHGVTDFWQCLHGATRNVDVDIKQHTAVEIGDVRSWLAERWEEKDAHIGESVGRFN